MNLEELIRLAAKCGASDLHLEAGLPPTVRVHGSLEAMGEALPAGTPETLAEELLGRAGWQQFRERGSADLSRLVAGVRCRFNVLQSSRGVGLAVRLLASFQPTLERLNLHPDLRRLVEPRHGLVVVSGPTGSGKSSTLAALLQELNRDRSCHIVTIEDPIEFYFRPRRAFIRQREVGRDTPSFQQGLRDALREDPDVLLVGEMRDAETMRLTLNAAETGHLVLTSMHASNVGDVLGRFISAFPAESRDFVQTQLADTLQGVVTQALRFHDNLQLRLPECELLRLTHPVKALIRAGHTYKVPSAMEVGARDGQWTLRRYRAWMQEKADWYAAPTGEPPDAEPHRAEVPGEREAEVASPPPSPAPEKPPAAGAGRAGGEDVIVLDEPHQSMDDILSELDDDTA